MTTTSLAHNFVTANTLRLELARTLPGADVRGWDVRDHSIRVHVGAEVGLWSDVEVRPELFRVAQAIDPHGKFTATNSGSYYTYRWSCEWAGVRVIVTAQGKGEPVETPGPLPKPAAVGVAA